MAPGSMLWSILLYVMGANEANMRANAVKILSMSLLKDGELKLDLKQLQSFEKVKGFTAMACRLAKHTCDDGTLNSLVDLLILANAAGHSQLTPTPTPGGSRATSPFAGEADLKPSLTPPLPRPFPDIEEGDQKNMRQDGEGGVDTSSLVSDGSSSLLSIFWKGARATTEVDTALQMEEDMNVKQHKQTILPCGSGSRDTERLAIPEVLESIFMLLETALNSDQVSRCTNLLERTFAAHRPKGGEVLSPGVDNHDKLALSNLNAITQQRDHILWIYDCLNALTYRTNYTTNYDDATSATGATSMSESEFGERDVYKETMSIGDSEASFELYSAASSYGDRYRSTIGDSNRRFTDPLFNLTKALIRIDLMSKSPSSSLAGVFQIPLPEGRDIQLTILFDVLDCIDEQPFDDSSMAPVIIRNFEVFLESVLEKVDATLDISVRVIEVINSLNYRAAPDIRASLKDSSLGDLKNQYISRCFADLNESLLNRIDALKFVASSLESYLVSADAKLFNGTQVSLLLFELFVDVTALIVTRKNDPLIQEAQIVMCKLIREASDVSSEARKCIGGLLVAGTGSVDDEPAQMPKFAPLFMGKRYESIMANSPVAASQSSWFSWSSALDEQGETSIVSTEETSVSSTALTNHGGDELEGSMTDYLARFNDDSEAELRNQLTDVVASKATTVHRFVDKMEERRLMRLSKFSNQLQEKMKVGRTKRQRATKATADRIRVVTAQFTGSFETEVRQRLDAVRRRYETGRDRVKEAKGDSSPSKYEETTGKSNQTSFLDIFDNN